MTHNRKTLGIIAVTALTLVLLLAGCAAKNSSTTGTPNAPTPPILQTQNEINLLAQSLLATTTAIHTARDNGQLPAATVVIADKIINQVAVTAKQINTELVTADDWPTMKSKIVKIITSSGVTAALTNAPATVRPYLTSAITLFNTVSASLEGPTI